MGGEIRIYGLTGKGLLIARNYRNPRDDPRYRIIACLYKYGRADSEKICGECNLTRSEFNRAMLQLRGIVGKE